MSSGHKDKASAQPGANRADAARAERLRTALRENLKRRKAQAKERSKVRAQGGGASHDSAGFVPDKSRD